MFIKRSPPLLSSSMINVSVSIESRHFGVGGVFGTRRYIQKGLHLTQKDQEIYEIL